MRISELSDNFPNVSSPRCNVAGFKRLPFRGVIKNSLVEIVNFNGSTLVVEITGIKDALLSLSSNLRRRGERGKMDQYSPFDMSIFIFT